MNKKVSIVIPVYNGSNYLKEAIDSALSQTYENLEIIVVNDGSTDNGKTRKVAEAYGSKIRYFEKENGGVATALNYGIEKMTGDYFSWLSHDDMYYPNKIEKEIEEIQKYDDHTILFSNFDLVNEKGNKINSVYLDHKLLTEKPDYAVLRGAIGGITLLIPKKAFEECGNFSPKWRCVQDYELWFRMIEKYKFAHIEDILSMTRIHGKQDTNTSPKMLTEGTWLWKHMATNYPLDKKIKCEGSEYLFYKEMGNYLKNTPYDETRQEILKIADDILEKEKKSIDKKSITVVVIDNGKSEELDKTINSINAQTFKNFNIMIEGKTKKEGIKNSKDREDSLKKIKTDFYTFLNAGVTAKKDWLENQILTAYLTNKAIVISDSKRPNRDNLADNPITLLMPIDGIIFNNKYKAKYIDDISYLYLLAKENGSFVTDDKYLFDIPEIDMVKLGFNYLKTLIDDEDCTEYQLASLCYDIACLYSDNNVTGKKIYMYHHCAEYEDMMNSRSFKMLKSYMDFKKKIRNR